MVEARRAGLRSDELCTKRVALRKLPFDRLRANGEFETSVRGEPLEPRPHHDIQYKSRQIEET